MAGMIRTSNKSATSLRRTGSDADSAGEKGDDATFLLEEIAGDEETVRHDGRGDRAVADEHRIQQLNHAVVLQ